MWASANPALDRPAISRPPGATKAGRRWLGCRATVLLASTLLVPGAATAASAASSSADPPSPIFAESRDSGIDFVHLNGMAGHFYMAEINSGGGGLLDYDGDGDLDLYLVQGGLLGAGSAPGAPGLANAVTDRLYRNDSTVDRQGLPVVRFTDVSRQSGITAEGYGFGIATGDYDDDGWIDLYVTNLGPNNLLRNDGDGRFTDVTDEAGVQDDRWSVPASFFDLDGDGLLDLFVGNYLDFGPSDNKVCRTTSGARDYCGPSAYPGVTDRLWRNRGGGRFEDITIASGIGGVASKSLGVVATDFDNDGRSDLYVANDRTPNQMWIRQPDGRFADQALLGGTAVNANGDAEASMGVDAGDFDGDGDDDLFMTHLERETNTLFENDGSGMFDDVTNRRGLGLPSWGFTSWGTGWMDYDNDGRLDVMIANGAVRVIEALANAGDPFPFHQPNQLFHQLPDGSFEEVTAAAGAVFELSEVSRALAVGDLDNDGDADAVVVNNSGPVRVLINQVGQRSHWLGLRLIGGCGGRDMLGARAALRRPPRPVIWRRVRSDGSFATSNDPRVVFGLGAATERGAVRVVWPDGAVAELLDLPVDRYVTLRQARRSGR